MAPSATSSSPSGPSLTEMQNEVSQLEILMQSLQAQSASASSSSAGQPSLAPSDDPRPSELNVSSSAPTAPIVDFSSLSPSDLALLRPLLSLTGAQEAAAASASRSGSGEGDGDGEGEMSVRDVLARMDAAQGAAVGLEGRLDALLSKLDGLLGGLEAFGGAREAEAHEGRLEEERKEGGEGAEATGEESRDA